MTLRELDNALSILEEIDEYKLYQMSMGDYHLHLVSQQKEKNLLQNKAEEILSELYGEEAKISIIFDESITPSASGKYIISQALFPINIEDFLDDRYICKRRTS